MSAGRTFQKVGAETLNAVTKCLQPGVRDGEQSNIRRLEVLGWTTVQGFKELRKELSGTAVQR